MATKPVGIGKPDGGKTFDLSPLNDQNCLSDMEWALNFLRTGLLDDSAKFTLK